MWCPSSCSGTVVQLDNFAVADRFIWDMAEIPRYKQRLQTLYYIRKVRRGLPRNATIY